MRSPGTLLIGVLALAAANSASAADKIGVSMPNIKGPWFTPVLYGISDEAKKFGYDVTIQDAGGYANVDKQVSQFSNLVVQKVAAILIDPANPASFNASLQIFIVAMAESGVFGDGFHRQISPQMAARNAFSM